MKYDDSAKVYVGLRDWHILHIDVTSQCKIHILHSTNKRVVRSIINHLNKRYNVRRWIINVDKVVLKCLAQFSSQQGESAVIQYISEFSMNMYNNQYIYVCDITVKKYVIYYIKYVKLHKKYYLCNFTYFFTAYHD